MKILTKDDIRTALIVLFMVVIVVGLITWLFWGMSHIGNDKDSLYERCANGCKESFGGNELTLNCMKFCAEIFYDCREKGNG